MTELEIVEKDGLASPPDHKVAMASVSKVDVWIMVTHAVIAVGLCVMTMTTCTS